ncbi:MAG TPA: hypothetical protein VKZ18_16150 [Polyangia bacterium]|nr:hypothetical protein [Polyangia bacterium]
MSGRAGFSSKCWRVLRWAGLAAVAPAVWACTSRTLEAPPITPTATIQTNFTQKINNEIDILFMIDNSSSMTEMQSKLYDQLPLFMNVLTSIPNPPSLHVAVVSSDMGAPGDSTSSIACTQFGDSGQFQSMPRGTCTNTSLTAGATFISDADGMPNYTDANIADVFQCIALLGDKGCGFEHQLASIDRALGADGQPPPDSNSNFLRPEAYLGIVILTNEDDCSAPPNTQLYSLNVGGSGQQNIANALGPIANYRCNQFGHLCKDPSGTQMAPPLKPPANAMGTAAAPTLDMTDCVSNDSTGLLTPVSQFISDVKALKPDPDNQILVAAITAPAAPYTVAWVPESGGQNTQPGELWPEVMHSCGAKGSDDVNPESTMSPTDGSFGDPGVRISQFVSAFPNYVLASICDASYASSMQAIATKLGQLITPPCIVGQIQNDSNGNPMCSVIEHLVDGSGNKSDRAIPACSSNGNAAPCWNLTTGGMNCNGSQLMINDESGVNPNSESSTINCSICLPGSTQPGC